jgi:hypothetical protein
MNSVSFESWQQRLTPVILASQEVEMGKIEVGGQPI